MAKRSKIAKQAQREALVARYAERRYALKEQARIGETAELRAAAHQVVVVSGS